MDMQNETHLAMQVQTPPTDFKVSFPICGAAARHIMVRVPRIFQRSATPLRMLFSLSLLMGGVAPFCVATHDARRFAESLIS